MNDIIISVWLLESPHSIGDPDVILSRQTDKLYATTLRCMQVTNVFSLFLLVFVSRYEPRIFARNCSPIISRRLRVDSDGEYSHSVKRVRKSNPSKEDPITMSVTRTPIACPADDKEDTRQDPMMPFFDANQDSARPGIAAETIDDTPHVAHSLRMYNHPDDPTSQAYAVRAVKTCTFWRDHAKTWFTQIEAKFRAHNIRSDDLKFCVVIDNLDKESMLEVADIIEAPPVADKYQRLKETLVSRLTDSDEKRWRKLLNDVELGDRKPTHLLREMRRLTGNAVDEQLLQTIWMQRLPTRIQELLSVAEGVAIDKLAELADKALERTLPAIASVDVHTVDTSTTQTSVLSAIENLTQQIQRLTSGQGRNSRARFRPRTRSNSRSAARDKSRTPKFCFYHKKFGKNARNCTQPCSWTKPLAVKAANDSEN